MANNSLIKCDYKGKFLKLFDFDLHLLSFQSSASGNEKWTKQKSVIVSVPVVYSSQ